jgi:hypothetical protein
MIHCFRTTSLCSKAPLYWILQCRCLLGKGHSMNPEDHPYKPLVDQTLSEHLSRAICKFLHGDMDPLALVAVLIRLHPPGQTTYLLRHRHHLHNIRLRLCHLHLQISLVDIPLLISVSTAGQVASHHRNSITAALLTLPDNPHLLGLHHRVLLQIQATNNSVTRLLSTNSLALPTLSRDNRRRHQLRRQGYRLLQAASVAATRTLMTLAGNYLEHVIHLRGQALRRQAHQRVVAVWLVTCIRCLTRLIPRSAMMRTALMNAKGNDFYDHKMEFVSS